MMALRHPRWLVAAFLLGTLGPAATAHGEPVRPRVATPRPIRLRTDRERRAFVKDVHGRRFAIGDVNPRGGHFNCAYCALALDDALAGRPWVVLSPDGPTEAELPGLGFARDRFQRMTHQEIARTLLAAGHGARGIVWGGDMDLGGHVWNAINDQGRVRFLDGQSGFEHTYEGYYRDLGFARTE